MALKFLIALCGGAENCIRTTHLPTLDLGLSPANVWGCRNAKALHLVNNGWCASKPRVWQLPPEDPRSFQFGRGWAGQREFSLTHLSSSVGFEKLLAPVGSHSQVQLVQKIPSLEKDWTPAAQNVVLAALEMFASPEWAKHGGPAQGCLQGLVSIVLSWMGGDC